MVNANPPKADLYSVETHFSSHGNFCLIDWLIANNYLDYSHYDRWRNGEVAFLDEVIPLEAAELKNIIGKAEEYCRKLKLSPSEKRYFQWNTDSQVSLVASRRPEINAGLTQNWLRAQDLPQLDIFLDNSDVGVENDLRNALENRRFQHARQKLEELGKINNAHPRLGVYQDLVNYGCHMDENPVDAPALSDEIDGLENEVEPLARETLGSQARDYLAFAWQRLAAGLQGIVFDPHEPRRHQSYALAKIPDWEAVKNLLKQEDVVFEQPVLLERWAIACRQSGDISHFWLLWCCLFEHHPAWAENVVENSDECDRELKDLWENFHDNDEAMDTAWFAAFILMKHRGLIHRLQHLPPFHHACSLAVVDLLRTAMAGGDEAQPRQTLQRTCRPLLAWYLRSHKT